jgi:hypothetical protein
MNFLKCGVNVVFNMIMNCGLWVRIAESVYRESLRAGWSGDRIPVERDFQHLSRTTLGPTQPPIQWTPVFFPGGKAVGAWC